MVTTAAKVINARAFPDREITAYDLQVREILKQVGPGKMPGVAYNTAWVARLGEIDPGLSGRSLDWLSENQLPDGSWGAAQPFYYHDRLISTLAAAIALAQPSHRERHSAQLKRGVRALERMTSDFTRRLRFDSNGPTVGFEMIAPTLFAEAESLGLIRRQGLPTLSRLNQDRERKLNLLKGHKISRHLTAAFSSEMAGEDGLHMFDIENLQGVNGSVSHSPSATAYFALKVKPGDEKALGYLHTVVDPLGGAPDQMPIDVFEAAWVLWNFSLVDDWDDDTRSLFRPLIAFLRRAWKPGAGIGLSIDFSVPDGDNTSFVYEILSRYGEPPDIEAVLGFEEKDCFRTFHFEAHSSPSVNIHALGVLRQAGFSFSSPSVQKILDYLRRTRVRGAYWFDKWHLSPYYTTAHAVIACVGFADELARPAVEWILQKQKGNGAWGYQFPTSEETAYCIQALEVWRRYAGNIPRSATQKAAAWLQRNSELPDPPLWIGKGLYMPELVVRSAILSALLMAARG
jgi:halimadienyl-diphosphate synthase